MVKIFAAIGCVYGFLSVALGAFGAHALKSKVEPKYLETWATAVDYQMYHALALIFVAWVLSQTEHQGATIAGWAFVAGVVLFSGSLYALVLSGIKVLGAITPLGGLSFLVGWVALLVAILRSPLGES